MTNFNKADNELCSWMMLNQDDLFPPINLSQNVLPSLPANPVGEDGLNPTSVKKTRARTTNRRKSSQSNVAPSIADEKEKKKQERLLRNREIARNCRKRKREKINAMEAELKQLRDEKKNLEFKVAQLQHNQAIVSNDTNLLTEVEEPQKALPSREARGQEYRKIEHLLVEYDTALMTNNKQDLNRIKKSIQEILNVCTEMYSDFGNARKSEIEFHMNQLENLLIPNQLTKISLWSLQQEDDFYDEKTKSKTFGGGLWNTICTEFDLTKEQKRGLIAMRNSVRKQRENIYECLKILKELKGRINTNFSSLKGQMRQILSITTPIQQARFLMWMEKNRACMYMLNSLWEQERTKTDPTPVENVKLETPVLKEEPQVKVSTEEMAEALKSSRAIRAMKKLIEKQCNSTEI